MEPLQFTLNQLTLTLAPDTGALLSMWGAHCGTLAQNGQGLIDIAWPVKYDYEILRAAPCGKHSKKPPAIQYDGTSLVISYAVLPLNTLVPPLDVLEGGLSASITLSACEDGQSLSLRCRVTNHSPTAVRQILFPDFSGLLPVSGTEDTRFTGLRGYIRPFLSLADTGDARDQFYAAKPSLCGQFFAAGGYFDQSMRVGRWYDYGGLSGGFSLYCKHWGYGPDNMEQMGQQDVAWVKLDNLANTVRIANVHDVALAQGETYTSPEYILTPHAGGWVHGIAPYKAWVALHKARAVPLPRQARNALGFRTIWATEQYPDDPDAAIWAYDDYPTVAEDMLAHGLTSLNIWGMFEWILPLDETRFFALQGGMDALARNVAILREKGVQIEAFVSWVSLWEKMRARYGYAAHDGTRAGWAENLKGVPCFVTPYMERYCCALLQDHQNPLWAEDVKAGLRFLRDRLGIPSISWDQYLLKQWVLYDIITEYRKETHALFPEATFSGESTYFFEADIDHLDYTWVWIYRNGAMEQDTAPYSHVVETTRPQMNVDANPLYVKYCFMDNVMINAYPSKPDNINGSALIRDYPALSTAYKQCARMREAYLPFFTEGTILGDCVLAARCASARVTGYAHGENALLFIVAHHEGMVTFQYDLARFVTAQAFAASLYDADGQLLDTYPADPKGQVRFPSQRHQLYALHFVAAAAPFA